MADHLNTHMSATLVERVATWCGIDTDLETKASREAFLTDPTHRIRFVYTPKHCSWLNQSLADLRERIAAFIAYFNETLAHPCRWTYTGRALKAS